MSVDLTDLPGFGPFRLDLEIPVLYREGREVRLRKQALLVLKCLFENPRGLTFEQLERCAWGNTSVSDKTIRNTIDEIKAALGTPYDSWIRTRRGLGRVLDIPESERHRFKPGPGSEVTRYNGNATSHPSAEGFTLAVDGIIFTSVAELINADDETEAVRRDCGASYQRCLEDFAFALIYGSKIVTSDVFRPSLTRPDQPGQKLIRQLGEVWGPRSLDDDLKAGTLLADPLWREHIKADIHCFASCVSDPGCVPFIKDYLVREAKKYLGTDSSLFREDHEPESYRFNVARPYYRNQELQDALGKKAINSLVAILPRSPEKSRDRYAVSALREFATQNVLSLLTIMREHEENARRNDQWAMPHVVRSLVKQNGIHRWFEERQQELRSIVVRHALVAALRRAKGIMRADLIAVLRGLRDERPFKQIREALEQEDLLLLEPTRAKETKARKILEFINGFAGLEDTDQFLLARQSSLRELRTTLPADYEIELFRVFPELDHIGRTH